MWGRGRGNSHVMSKVFARTHIPGWWRERAAQAGIFMRLINFRHIKFSMCVKYCEYFYLINRRFLWHHRRDQ